MWRRPLDGRGQLPLVERTRARDPAGRDLAPVGDVALQDVGVLVVDELDVALAEAAELLLGREKFLVGRPFRAVAAVVPFGLFSSAMITPPRGISSRPGRSRRRLLAASPASRLLAFFFFRTLAGSPWPTSKSAGPCPSVGTAGRARPGCRLRPRSGRRRSRRRGLSRGHRRCGACPTFDPDHPAVFLGDDVGQLADDRLGLVFGHSGGDEEPRLVQRHLSLLMVCPAPPLRKEQGVESVEFVHGPVDPAVEDMSSAVPARSRPSPKGPSRPRGRATGRNRRCPRPPPRARCPPGSGGIASSRFRPRPRPCPCASRGRRPGGPGFSPSGRSTSS